jgi:hypothetical protein
MAIPPVASLEICKHFRAIFQDCSLNNEITKKSDFRHRNLPNFPNNLLTIC